ncbi:MAG: type IV secretion system protein TraC, partial [Betaproteobacteria bacterium]|nr:type IV secretion system protein TraC [Betaproteobacteria bacterium]
MSANDLFMRATDTLKELIFGNDFERDNAKVEDQFSDINFVRNSDGSVPRMAPWLPYLAFDAHHQLFINSGNTLGFCIEAMPLTGATENTAAMLAAIYAKCPKDTGIQFQLLASSETRPLLAAYGNQRILDADAPEKARPYGRPARNDNMYRRFARRRVAHFQQASQQSLTRGLPYLLRDFRLVISFNVPGRHDSTLDVQRAVDIRETVINTLRAAGIGSSVMDAAAFIGFTRLIGSYHYLVGDAAKHPVPKPSHDTGRELREQIFAPDRLYVEQAFRILNFSPMPEDGERDSTAVHMLSLRDYPDEMGLWDMGQLVGHMLNSAIQYTSPYLITLGVQVQDPEKIRAWVIANQTRATQNSKSQMAEMMPDIPKKKRDWDMAANTLDSGGTMVSLYHHIAVFVRPDKGLEAENMAINIWNARSFVVMNSKLHQMPAYLASFPMMLSKPFHDDMKKLGLVSTKTNHNAIHMSPLLADWKGIGRPVMVYGGRRGQVVSLDLFANEAGNYNACVVGTSGSGKSTFVQDLMYSYAGTGAQVFGYDLGRSMERLCKVLGGTYSDIGRDENLCYNPFSSVTDIMEDVSMIKPIVALMCSPRGLLDDYQYQALEVAILLAYGKYGPDTTMTHVRDVLATGRLRNGESTPDQRILDMAVMIDPYTKDGAYGRFFEGRASFDYRGDFYVFENESLIRKPDLHAVLTLLSLYNITGAMFLTRNRRKLFVVDEFKQQLAGAGASTSFMAEAVSAASLRARKYGGALITATQNPQHYYDSPAGLAAWDTADWKFLSRLTT